MKQQALLCMLLSILMIAPQALCASTGTSMRGAAEFSTTNLKQRLLVEVQIWGDINAPGVYHVPDITNLSELISLAGGPKGSIDNLEVKVTRKAKGKKNLIKTYSGEEFITSNNATSWVMKTGDVVYIQTGSGTESLMRTLSIVSAITGTITSVALVVFLAKDSSK